MMVLTYLPRRPMFSVVVDSAGVVYFFDFKKGFDYNRHGDDYRIAQ